MESLASSLVKITENDKMTVYVFPDSIKKNENNVSFKELVDLKEVWKNKENKDYRSHILEQTINCETQLQTVHFMTVFSENMSKGKVVEKGEVPNPPRIIPVESQSFKIMKYVCSYKK